MFNFKVTLKFLKLPQAQRPSLSDLDHFFSQKLCDMAVPLPYPSQYYVLLRYYILSNGQLLYRSARPVPPNARKRPPVYTTGRTGHRACIR